MTSELENRGSCIRIHSEGSSKVQTIESTAQNLQSTSLMAYTCEVTEEKKLLSIVMRQRIYFVDSPMVHLPLMGLSDYH